MAESVLAQVRGDPEVAGDTLLRLAIAVARPGSDAMRLGADNRARGWDRISTLVASGRPFVVELDHDVVAAEWDGGDLFPLRQRTVERVRAAGGIPVVVASGRPGHFHVFARVLDERRRLRLQEELKGLGLELRRHIRPPLSPHRLGLPVALMAPDSPEEALAALRPTQRSAPPQERPRGAPRPLSAEMAELLAYGDLHGRYAAHKRSGVIMAIAVAAARAGWTEQAYRAAMLDPRNAAGAKLRERSTQWADVELGRCWQKAQALVASTPLKGRASDLRLEVDRLTAIVEAVDWPGQAGATDRHVLLAALDKVRILARSEFPWSQREAAEAAAVSTPTIVASRRRLIGRGLLERAGGDEERRSVWTVRLEAIAALGESARVLTNLCHTPPYGGATRGSGTRVCGTRGQNSRADAPLDHDAWRQKAPGKSGRRLLRELRLGPATSGELASRVGLHSGHVWRMLVRLEAQELVERHGRVWRLAEGADLELAAALAGTDGTGCAQRHRHQAERRAHERGRRHSLRIAGICEPGDAPPPGAVPVPVRAQEPQQAAETDLRDGEGLRLSQASVSCVSRADEVPPAGADVREGGHFPTGGDVADVGPVTGDVEAQPIEAEAASAAAPASRAGEQSLEDLHQEVARLSAAAGWPRTVLSDGTVIRQGPAPWASFHLRADGAQLGDAMERVSLRQSPTGGDVADVGPVTGDVEAQPIEAEAASAAAPASRAGEQSLEDLHQEVARLSAAAGWPRTVLSDGTVIRQGPAPWASFHLRADRGQLKEAAGRLDGKGT